MGEDRTASFKCETCSEVFIYAEVLEAHKSGHAKADEFLYKFYIDKIKPTEIEEIKQKRKKPKKKKFSKDFDIPELMPIPVDVESQASVLNRLSGKPKRMIKRPLPSLRNPKPKLKPVPAITPPESKRPKLLLKPPEPRETIPEYELKLMECQNKRKAEKRELMGLPPLEPYYCKNFGSKNCCFSSIYWASMRRHFDSKHPELKLKLPKDSDRHACSCGRTFLEPNRLQEHMETSNHKVTIPADLETEENDENQNGKENSEVEDDDVTDWQFYVQT